MALQVSTYSMFCTSVPPLFICLLFSLNCLVSAESLSGFCGLFWPAISIAVSVIAEVTFSHSELRSGDVAKAPNLLVSSVWYFVVLADSTAVFGFLHRWMRFALSSLLLMVKEPRTMRWSLPVLRLLMIETSVEVCGLLLRIKSISFFVWPLGEIHVQRLLGLFLNIVFMIFNWCLTAKLIKESPLALRVPNPWGPVPSSDALPCPVLALKIHNDVVVGFVVVDEVVNFLIDSVHFLIGMAWCW